MQSKVRCPVCNTNLEQFFEVFDIITCKKCNLLFRICGFDPLKLVVLDETLNSTVEEYTLVRGFWYKLEELQFLKDLKRKAKRCAKYAEL